MGLEVTVGLKVMVGLDGSSLGLLDYGKNHNHD